MAAASPILINSSSPQSIRFPSITPPSAQRISKKDSFPSPQLPSPSTFVKPRAVGLKSGSRAQNAPEGVKVGIASLGNLWREKKLDVEQDGYSENALGESAVGRNVVGKVNKTLNECIGKLVKPKRKAKTSGLGDAPKCPLLKGVEERGDGPTRQFDVANEVRPNVYEVPTDHKLRTLPWTCKANVGLSEDAFEEYALEIGNEETAVTEAAKVPKRAKKPRKTSVKTEDENGKFVAKKPKKRKAKSEAIIVNSDEPEPDGDVMSAHFLTNGTNVADNVRPVADKPKPKKTTSKSEREKTHLPSVQQGKELSKAMNTSNTGTNDICGDYEASDKSIYFTKPVVPAAKPSESLSINPPVRSPASAKEPTTAVTSAQDMQSMDIASRRRRSWTPAKNTEVVTLPLSRPPTADSGISDASHVPPFQLADMIGKFSCDSADSAQTVPLQRSASGAAATKRRRIELADVETVDISASKSPKHIAPKQKKRAKGPKKAQTITALATAAFLPPKDTETNESVVSAFASPQKDAAAGSETRTVKAQDPQSAVVKPKKPRKPRVKPSTAAGTNEQTGVPTKPNKSSISRKKRTSKTKEVHERPRLYSPTRAVAQIREQAFLFGTSSQLALSGSPEYIRPGKTASRESEDVHYGSSYQEDLPSQAPPSPAAVVSPREKSCARVPTAPHGTCLSIEQAGRALWCRSARDFEGSLLSVDERNGVIAEAEAEVEAESKKLLDDTGKGIEIEASRNVDLLPDVVGEASVVDLCTSSSALLEEAKTEAIASEQAGLQMEGHVSGGALIPQSATLAKEEEDTWMILCSDESDSVLQQLPVVAGPNMHDPSSASLKPPAADKLLSSRMFRPVLYPLDSNAGIALFKSPAKASSFNPVGTFSATVSDESRNVDRPRGRPREDAGSVSSLASSPKKPGRPAKVPVAASSPPRLKLKKTKPGLSATQRAYFDWLDIDEISDSDAPTTPSPPRKSASSSPPAVRPLILSPSSSQVDKRKAPVASSGPVMKPDGPQWPSMRATLFPYITDAVKSGPRSTDPAKPSWWEKILLYDPIVVEDLTAWLDEQGLRVKIQRQKTKRSGKRKGDTDQNESAAEVEWETYEEPLQPWMVQKWCEEKSVCCYTKDGGWRRAR